MSDRDFPNSGIMFRDARKKYQSDRDARGSGDIICPRCDHRFQFWISGWIKEGLKGRFTSLRSRPSRADDSDELKLIIAR
jgi:hypothetical protein